MSDLRIVRGNTFYTRTKITARDAATGSIVQGFSLDACEDLRFFAVRRGKSIEITSFSILDSTHIRIKWNGNDMKVGGYGLEGTGKYNGLEWRFYDTERYVFTIVESNDEANIPASAFIETDYYQIETQVSLISSLGNTQSDWNQTDSSDPSYIRNKPDLTIYVEKVAGYGLSKNDYSDAEKQKVAASVFAILDSTQYNSVTREVHFLNRNGDTIASMDATPFVKDGYLSNVVASEGFLSFIFNSDSEKSPISISLSDLMDYTNIYTKSEVDSELSEKVDKVNGKGLSTNDYTNTEKSKLASLSNYDDTEVRSMINAKYTKPSSGIPASDLASGVIPDVSQFITKSVNDLANYYTKTQTYTQAEVDALLGAINQFHYEIAESTSAVVSPASNVLYLIGPTGSGSDKYEEYVYTTTWVKIGDTSIDLSGYVTTTDLNTALAGYQTKIDSTHKLDYSLLDNTPTIPAAQVQSNWNESDTNSKAYIQNKPTIPAAGIPSGGNAGQVLTKTDGSTDYAVAWRDTNNIFPSAYCTTAAATAAKGASCTFWTATANSYLHILLKNANTNQGALSLNVNSTGAKPIYINGTVSSSTNYTLPAGSYIVFYDGTNYYFRTDGKLTANITGMADAAEAATNKVTSLSSQSTDTQYPSAKCVYDLVGDIETLLSSI